MKHVLAAILCIVLITSGAFAEDSLYFELELCDAFDLGFSSADGSERIIPAGDGYLVLWREDLETLYVYVPDEGWQYVNSDNTDISAECPSYVKKGNGFILVDDFIIDLEDYSVCLLPNIYWFYSSESARTLVTDDGKLYVLDSGRGNSYTPFDTKGNPIGKIDFSASDAKYPDCSYTSFNNDEMVDVYYNALVTYTAWLNADGNGIGKLDFSALDAEYPIISYLGFNNDETIVVYSDSLNTYAAWLDADGNILQNNFICAGLMKGDVAYSHSLDALVFNRTAERSEIFAVSYRNGTTYALFYDDLNAEYLHMEAHEVEYDARAHTEYPAPDFVFMTEDETAAVLIQKTGNESYHLIRFDIVTHELTIVPIDAETYSILKCCENDRYIFTDEGITYRITE